MCLDDEVSTIAVNDRNMNFISNKSSKIDLNCPVPRPHSASRRDFQFGSKTTKHASNSFLRQSINPTSSCCNQYPNLTMTYQNPLTVSMNRPLCQSV